MEAGVDDLVPGVPEGTCDDLGAPVVAVSDWVRALPDLIRQWVPAPFVSLGTDGFGLSDTRPAVRRHFNVDAQSITVAALRVLADRRGA